MQEKIFANIFRKIVENVFDYSIVGKIYSQINSKKANQYFNQFRLHL
jgi:hypothetical protein